MGVAMTYGGWGAGNSVGTSNLASRNAVYSRRTVESSSTAISGSVSFVQWLGCVAAAGVALTGIGTGGELSIEHLQGSAHQMQYLKPTVDVALIRTPAEDLVRIREVMRPAVSDLAVTFGVSRQSIYNWANGEAVADENALKLKDLAQAADILDREGITINAALLKRKFANGQTLMQLAQIGKSARLAAMELVHIHKREMEQRERMAARFANREKTSLSADFDLPSASDNA